MAADDPTSAARAAHLSFLKLVEPHRHALWRYCRELCRTPWDAEDLLQETLAKAYAKLLLLWQAVDLPSYLRRMAKNCWLDSLRRKRDSLDELLASEPIEEAADAGGDPMAIRAVFQDILGTLTPRQTAVLLYSVAGFEGPEIASKMGMSHGAVRVELSRARARLAGRAADETPRPAPLLDAFVAAYNAHDADALASLLAEHVRADIVGVAEEAGRKTVLESSIADDLSRAGLEAHLVSLYDEPVIAVAQDGKLVQVMRLATTSSAITEIRTYYFCPEMLSEVALALGMPARNNGYYFVGPEHAEPHAGPAAGHSGDAG